VAALIFLFGVMGIGPAAKSEGSSRKIRRAQSPAPRQFAELRRIEALKGKQWLAARFPHRYIGRRFSDRSFEEAYVVAR
jgi:hypothetical protein